MSGKVDVARTLLTFRTASAVLLFLVERYQVDPNKLN